MPPSEQPAPQPVPTTMPTPEPPKPRRVIVPWVLVGVLVVIIGVSLALWRPWLPNIKASERTITVTGDTTVTATPDQYTFSPSYSVSNADRPTALNALASKSDQLVAGLKAQGVSDSAIKTNSSGFNSNTYLPAQVKGGVYTYDLELTVTITDAALAQKVQNYLVSTVPTGAVSPEVDFSEAKQKSLQDSARQQAEKDAKSKAAQSAVNLGFKLDAVKSVTDGSLGNGNTRPLIEDGISGAANAAAPQLSIQPGQNQLSYVVTVVYYIH